MLRVVLISLVMVVSAGAAGDEELPDMRGILSLRGWRGAAHGCAISSTYAITAGHVMKPLPGDDWNYGIRWSDELGGEGRLVGVWISDIEDLAVVKTHRSQRTFNKIYKMAEKPPIPGEKVYWKEYNWSNDKDGHGEISRSGTVTRNVAGHVVFRKDTPIPGASGSCLLNSNNEVVGVIESYQVMSNHSVIGGAVGIWGEFAMPIKEVTK